VVRELKRGYAVRPPSPSFFHKQTNQASAYTQAEELLRNAGDGNAAAIAQVQAIVRRTSHEIEKARKACPPFPRPAERTIPAPFPNAPKVLDVRPLPKEQLSGRRRVPILTAANWLPFLRFKRPQSRFLGRVLRDKLEQKKGRWEGMEGCDGWVEVGESEGVWEGVVKRAVREEIAVALEGDKSLRARERVEKMKAWLEGEGREFGESKERFNAQERGVTGGRSKWAIEAARQKYVLWEKISAENEKALERGKRMLEIVEKEKVLYEQERKERRDAKRAKRGKGPGGGGGQPPVDVKSETGEGFESWTPVGSLNQQDMKIVPNFKAASQKSGIDLQWARREPNTAENKPQTEEDLMERKLEAMQLSQSKAGKAYSNAAPTF
jgi:hypothetical protein